MSRKRQMPEAGGRVVSYYRTSYERAMEQVERDRGRMFDVIRRAWASPSVEEAARRIGAGANNSETGMTFDEVLFWLYEQICHHGSGAVAEWMTETKILCAKCVRS